MTRVLIWAHWGMCLHAGQRKAQRPLRVLSVREPRTARTKPVQWRQASCRGRSHASQLVNTLAFASIGSSPQDWKAACLEMTPTLLSYYRFKHYARTGLLHPPTGLGTRREACVPAWMASTRSEAASTDWLGCFSAASNRRPVVDGRNCSPDRPLQSRRSSECVSASGPSVPA